MSERRNEHWQWLVLILAFLGLLALLIFGGFFKSEEGDARADYRLRYRYDNIREFDGVQYRQRKNLTTVLLMGIDNHTEDMEDHTYIYGGGQADFLRLVVIDPKNMRVTQIQIDRDTMTPIMILGPSGDELGYGTYQICLAHGYGDGKEQSCLYQVDAVSKFLLDIDIGFYMSLNLDGISALNDQLGGVTVTLGTDFSSLDPTMVEGATITLMGKQAEIYTRTRMAVDDGTNQSRMKRQQEYIAKLSAKLNRRVNADKNFAGDLYDALEEYLVTNISRGQLINEAWTARRYERSDVLEIEGEHYIGAEGFMEFHADPQALQDLIIDVFYERLE